jgi:hypothetical protein
MTSGELLPAAVLKRKAVVYVRQSTQAQVQTNLESQRRQYDLVDVARQRGFHDIEVIDDDLGRSASGMVARPGFGVLRGVGGCAERARRGLYRQGGVRTEQEAARGKVRQGGRCKVRARRTRVAGRAAIL